MMQQEMESSSSSSHNNARSDSPSPTSLSHYLFMLAKLILLLFLWIISLIVADRFGLLQQANGKSAGKSLLKNTTTIIGSNQTQSGRIEDRYDFSRPASINYTAIVRELGLARVFSQRFMEEPGSSLPPWCTYDNKHLSSKFSNRNNWPFHTGILYIKMPKAASSTTSGIVLRISNNVAARFSAEQRCTSYESHITREGRVGKLFAQRDRNRSFLFSSLRDPAKQAVSKIFFSRISRENFTANDANMMGFLQDTRHQEGVISRGQGGYQVGYLTEARIQWNSAWHKVTPNQVIHRLAVHRYVRTILEDYDFMISVERFEESLVVMQLLLGLEATDILYASSKKAGSSYIYSPNKGCFFLHKPFVSERVAAYLASDEWYAKQYGDYVLKEAVQQSLDLTIDALGKDRFEQALETFLRLKEQANEECADKAVFPCSKDGVPQPKLAEKSCYFRDWGCGYKCLDNLTAVSDNNRIL
jgi:hypothetical protein